MLMKGLLSEYDYDLKNDHDPIPYYIQSLSFFISIEGHTFIWKHSK